MTDGDKTVFRWLVTDFGPSPRPQDHVVGAAWVWAATETEAAELGRRVLIGENEDHDPDYCETVAVVPVSGMKWFEFDAKAVPAELQCCGGAGTLDGHTGFCEHRP